MTSIAKKYTLSEQVEGILLAIGASIPEFTTNLIASLSNSVDIGIGAIAGSGSYDFTICFGFASLFTFGMNLHAGLYYRDSIVYLLTLGLLTYFLIDQQINIYEAAILTCLWPIYVGISMYMTNNTSLTNQEIQNPKCAIDIKENERSNSDIVLQIINDDNSHNNNTFPSSCSMITNKIKDNINDDEDHKLIQTEIEIEIEKEKEERKEHSTSEQAIIIHNKTLYFYLENVYESIGKLYSKLIPLWVDAPIFSFCIIMILIFLHSNLIVFTIQNISDRLKISKTFLGMTIISWGGNIGDTITACVAAKINASALISTSILGSQITNLQLCLGFPWLIAIIKRHLQGANEINIVFGSLGTETQSNPLYYFVPLLICVLFSMIIFGVFRMRLNKLSGGLLSLVYFVYFAYESYIQAHYAD